MIRLYTETDGRLRFARKDVALERRALAEIMGRRRGTDDRLHAENMALLGERVTRTNAQRSVLHVVHDEGEEALWRAWRAYSGT